jgi:lipopolysaccharide export system permease protein
MKTLHVYLTRQITGTLLMTVAVFTFVLMLATVLKEVLGLLVSGQASFSTVGQAIVLLIPWVLVFALPMGLLTATLLVFGRLSADQELTAVRAGGVSLVALITPVLLLSVALSGLSAIINLEIAPRCRVAYRELLVPVIGQSSLLLPEKTYIRHFTNSVVYISKVRGTNLENVLIYTLKSDKVDNYLRADRGNFRFNPSANVLVVRLFNFNRVFFTEGHNEPQTLPSSEIEYIYTNVVSRRTRRIDVSDSTFSQLKEQLRNLEEQLGESAVPEQVSSAELRQKMRFLMQKKKDLTMPVLVQMHRQVAFSFACIGFTLVGIPLGIRAHRRETTFGIAVALLLVLVYYGFFVLGQSLDTRPELAPHLLLWFPNFFFQAVGIVLLWRANRGL